MWDNKWNGLNVECIDENFYVRLRDLENKYDAVSKQEQAQIIMKHLEKYVSIDAAFEEYYVKAIVAGLAEIERGERR